jgi:hypothetical protein
MYVKNVIRRKDALVKLCCQLQKNGLHWLILCFFCSGLHNVNKLDIQYYVGPQHLKYHNVYE